LLLYFVLIDLALLEFVLLDFVLLDFVLLDFVLLDLVFEVLVFDELVFVVLVGSSGFVATLTAAALDVAVGAVVFCAFVTVTFEVFVATGFDVAVMEVGMRVDVAFDEPAAFTTVLVDVVGSAGFRTVLVAVVEPEAFSTVGVGDAVVDEALVAAPAGVDVPGVEVGTLGDVATPSAAEPLDDAGEVATAAGAPDEAGAGATGEVVIGADDEVALPAPGSEPPVTDGPVTDLPASGWPTPGPTVTPWGMTGRPEAIAAASLSAMARAADCCSEGSAGSPGCGSTAGREADGAGKIRCCSCCACWAGERATSGTGTGSASGSTPLVSEPAAAAGRVAPR
jgi:hypothetical protein